MRRSLVLLALLASTCFGQSFTSNRQFALQSRSSKFWKLFDHDAKLETLASGFGFTEGALWDEKGYVWVSDETLNKLFKVYDDGRKEEWLAIGDPDGNTYDKQRRLLDCASVLRAIIRFKPESKQYEVLADRYEGKKFNSPNDVVIGPDNAIYFTDPTYDLPKGEKQEIPFQGVYRLDEHGGVQLLTKDLKQPNGLAFSPDGKRLYIDDSDAQNIHVFDFSDGKIAHGRVFAVEPGNKDDGVPDGMRVDADGNVYVTGPLGIWVWDPQGHHLGTIALPEQPANLAWGGKNFDTLYITATTSVYKLKTRVHGFVPYLSDSR
jgi:gluconolactonase